MSDFPSDWRECMLSEVVEKITSGGTPKADNPHLYGGGIPFLKIDDITSSSKYLRSHKITINERGLSESSAKIVPTGTLLLTMYGTIGRCCITTYPVATNQAIASFLGHPEVELEYLYYALESKADEFATASSQTTQANISAGILKQTPIAIPPLPEQKKIAEILSGIDRTISRASALLQKEKIAFHAVLNEQIENIDDRHQKKAGDMIEENILTAMKDGNHGEQYPKKSEFIKTGIPYLSASQISDDGDIDLATCPCLSPERSRLMRIPPAEGGDVILTHNASIGKVAIIPKNLDIVIASTSTTYYRTNEDILGREFLAVTMKSDFYQNQLKRIMGQTTRNQVPITAQRELLLITPPRDIQERISQIYTSYKSIRLGRVAQVEGLQFLKRSLSADLLSGRKRVSI